MHERCVGVRLDGNRLLWRRQSLQVISIPHRAFIHDDFFCHALLYPASVLFEGELRIVVAYMTELCTVFTYWPSFVALDLPCFCRSNNWRMTLEEVWRGVERSIRRFRLDRFYWWRMNGRLLEPSVFRLMCPLPGSPSVFVGKAWLGLILSGAVSADSMHTLVPIAWKYLDHFRPVVMVSLRLAESHLRICNSRHPWTGTVELHFYAPVHWKH
jgi:hypothetical protein